MYNNEYNISHFTLSTKNKLRSSLKIKIYERCNHDLNKYLLWNTCPKCPPPSKIFISMKIKRLLIKRKQIFEQIKGKRQDIFFIIFLVLEFFWVFCFPIKFRIKIGISCAFQV